MRRFQNVWAIVSRVIAAIDCGSQSTRLLIRDQQNVYSRDLVTTKLSDGLAETGQISPIAQQRFYAALEHFLGRCNHFEVDEIVAIATAAARRASNSSFVLEEGSRILDTPIEVIGGETEAALAFAGAAASLTEATGDFLVFDIGGASTEFAFGHRTSLDRPPELSFSRSLEMGAVTTSQSYLRGDPPTKDSVEGCIASVVAALEAMKKNLDIGNFRDVHVLGCAGTVASAVAITLGLAQYSRDLIHHFRLTRADVAQLLYDLASLNSQDRVRVVGLEVGRVDSIIGGVCILSAIMDSFDLESIIASEDDMLDALCAQRLK